MHAPTVDTTTTTTAAVDEHRPRLLVLWGSQTGSAEEVSSHIVRAAKRRHWRSISISLDDFDRGCLPDEDVVVYVVSTTGQGDVPDNMKAFWRFMCRRNLPSDVLSGVSFAVFGLGDSSYSKFNFVGKKLHRRMLQLGGNALIERGDGDDQHTLGLNGALDPWLDDLWTTLEELHPDPRPPISADERPPPRYSVSLLTKDNIDMTSPVYVWGEPGEANGLFDINRPCRATLNTHQRITSPDHFQDVRHVKLDISSDLKLSYRPGDVAVILPANLSNDVDDILNHFGYDPLQWIHITQSDPDFVVPVRISRPMTLRTLFTYHLDVFRTPGRYFYELLAHFAGLVPLQQERLREFASSEGQEDMYAYSRRTSRSAFEVLVDFSQSTQGNIPLEYTLDLFPLLQPRAFSIASAPAPAESSCKRIELCVGLVEYKTKLVTPRVGVCSKWIRSLTAGDIVPIFIQPSTTLHLPDNIGLPIIMVGPGTGVAPFRSFIQQRASEGLLKGTIDSPNMVLFFGCRYRRKDYHYEDEWASLSSINPGIKVVTAFSRDQEKKVYVQDMIRENAKMVYDVLYNRGGYLYIAGNAKNMPDAVHDAIRSVLVDIAGVSSDEAEIWLQNLEKQGRYQKETWS